MIGGPKLRALVVEDEWAARNYLVELLERSGAVQVIGAAANAEDARTVLHRFVMHIPRQTGS